MEPPPSFGSLLKWYRAQARLTQEELAERAQLSVRGLIHLEHDTRRPYRDTLRRLVEALHLTPAQLDELAAAAYPAPSPLASPVSGLSPSALPSPTTDFIGRARELAAIRQLLASHRLVTLTGPGGSGKTRLAVEVGYSSSGNFRDGARFVELATAATPASVPTAIASALGCHVVPGTSSTDALVTHLASCDPLLILDNCEHLVDSCAALVAALLARCPGLTVLTTSREPLRVAGEQLYHVPVLSLPDHPHPGLTAVQQSEAAQLLLARAAAVRPGQSCMLRIDAAASRRSLAWIPPCTIGKSACALRGLSGGYSSRGVSSSSGCVFSNRSISARQRAAHRMLRSLASRAEDSPDWPGIT
jgi:transcriptional regulator with XRE-family HTH domain